MRQFTTNLRNLSNLRNLRNLSLDTALLCCLLLALAYNLTNNRDHELVGCLFFVLAILHNLIHARWYTKIRLPKHAPRQSLGTILNYLLGTCMLMVLGSGVFQSQDLFPGFFQIFSMLPEFKPEQSLFSRKLHTSSAYWSVILLSLHLGLHLKMILASLSAWTNCRLQNLVLRHALGISLIIYGLYAFMEHNLINKLMGWDSFSFWDASYILFFLDYLAMIGAGMGISHYALELWNRLNKLNN